MMLGAMIGDIFGSRFNNNHLSTDFELFAAGCGFSDEMIEMIN